MTINRIGGLQSSLLSELTQILSILAGGSLYENNLLSIKTHQPEDLAEVGIEEVLNMTGRTVDGSRTGDYNQVSALKMPDTCLILVTEVDAGLDDRVYKLLEWIRHTVVPHWRGNNQNINCVDIICCSVNWVKQILIPGSSDSLKDIHFGLRMS